MVPRFGTDGIRGVANLALTPELVLALGRATARVFAHERVLVGRDPRVSGPMLQAALSAGLAAEGVSVVDLGVLPTAGIAFASAELNVPAAVISASHNAFADNGVKLFAPGGRKLDDATERRLEAALDVLLGVGRGATAPTGAGVGRLSRDGDIGERYARHLVAALDGRRLDGLAVVVDCANGAASQWAPRVLAEVGARLQVLSADPNGTNINLGCGSTYPEALAKAVVATEAAVGLAFDGDADRVLAVDHTGALVDGDQLLALCALDRRARGRLVGDGVVVTVMANLGLRRAMAAAGITVHETSVGDRHVLAALEAGGWSLGGEQSGHIVFTDLATTGDGILTGLQVLDVMVRTSRTLADLAATAMTRLPQVLESVTVISSPAQVMAAVASAADAAQTELGDAGRVLVRPSGTEPLVRVMVEAVDEARARATVERLVAAVEAADRR